MKIGIKGVSAVIATLLMLLITVAIAATAYTYITGMSGGAKQCLMVADSYCIGGTGVTIKLRNVCADTIASESIAVTRTVPAGSPSKSTCCGGAMPTKNVTAYTDTACTTSGAQCSYRFLGPSGDAVEETVYCS